MFRTFGVSMLHKVDPIIGSGATRSFSLSQAKHFHVTEINYGAQMKRRKRLDPEVAKKREERKRRKLTSEITQLLRHSKKLKPIDEMSLDIRLQRKVDERRRPVETLEREELERRALLLKEWSRYSIRVVYEEKKGVEAILRCQRQALAELRKLSPQLYEAAIQLDQTELPLKIVGPVHTPPVSSYVPPDGDFFDTTRKWTPPAEEKKKNF